MCENFMRGSRSLIEAVLQEDDKLVEQLLADGINVNARENDETGNGLLYYSILSDNLKIIKLLLRHGVYVNETNCEGARAIDVSFMSEKTEHVKLLLDRGARLDINLLSHFMKNPKRRDYVELIYKYVDLLDRDKNGLSALHLAVTYGDVEGIIMLLKRGAAINERTVNNGYTALHIAARTVNTQCLQVLLKHGAKLHFIDDFGCTALHTAVSYESNTERASANKRAFVQMLLDAGAHVDTVNDNGQSALFIAAGNADYKCVKLLLKGGATVNMKDDFDCTPLSKLIDGSDHLKMHEKRQVKVLKLLLDAGANVNEQLEGGFTPLHIAIKRGKFVWFDLFLNHGGQPNLKDVRGYTPLHELASLPNDKIQMSIRVRMAHRLLGGGADFNDAAVNGKTPLHCAIEANADGIVQAILKHVALEKARCMKEEISAIKLSTDNMKLILRSASWTHYYISCEQEVEKMQSEWIWHNLTFFDFLMKDALNVYWLPDEVNDFFNSPQYQMVFPLYFKFLKGKYNKIEVQKKHLNKAVEDLKKVLQCEVNFDNIITNNNF